MILDPDNGLASSTIQSKHVTYEDIKKIWSKLKPKDILVLYQHAPREVDWKAEKRKIFASACGCSISEVNKWDAPEIANDVIFFYIEKQ